VIRTWQHLKNVYHLIQAHAWRWRYGRPDRALSILGVTGTNGKTTTCYVLDSILAVHLGRARVGMLTTTAVRIGAAEQINETKLTTLPSRAVYRTLSAARAAGVTHVVLEVTSHALDQNRVAGLALDGAILLNIAREHLDYHQTMAAYTAAKARIVSYLKRGAPFVVRADVLDRLAGESARLGAVRVLSFTAAEAQDVVTALPGDFNKENVLAASKLAEALGISAQSIEQGISRLRHVPGRMEWVNAESGAPAPRVLIDYAVTPDALEQLYRLVRREAKGKIFAVFGAAGQRDRGKRELMARVVSQFADEVVLTREDPWGEDEEQIFADLERGLTHASGAWRRIGDRRAAIRYCLAHAGPNDVVVVTGKGAERGMALGRRIIPWSDRAVIEELLAERTNS
jgi:UDP-N-acetylmuramyl tripeptide synthase